MAALHTCTTLYGSAAGCRSIQKTCALWKHGLTSKNTQSQLTYFCKSNINQTFTNDGGMIWGVRMAIFTEIRHLVEELITFLSIFGYQKLGILTARLNRSLSLSTSIQWEKGLVCWSMPKTFTAIVRTTAFDMFEKLCDGTRERSCTPSKVSWIGIIVCGRDCEQWCKVIIRDLAYFDSHTVFIKVCDTPHKTDFRPKKPPNLPPWNSKSIWIMPSVLSCAVITLCEH